MLYNKIYMSICYAFFFCNTVQIASQYAIYVKVKSPIRYILEIYAQLCYMCIYGELLDSIRYSKPHSPCIAL